MAAQASSSAVVLLVAGMKGFHVLSASPKKAGVEWNRGAFLSYLNMLQLDPSSTLPLSNLLSYFV
jgi:hypothetical protein